MKINVHDKPLTAKKLQQRQQRLRGEFIWAVLTTCVVVWLSLTEQGWLQAMFMGTVVILLLLAASIYMESTKAYTLIDNESYLKVHTMSEQCPIVHKYWSTVRAEGRSLVASELTALTKVYRKRKVPHTVTVQLKAEFLQESDLLPQRA